MSSYPDFDSPADPTCKHGYELRHLLPLVRILNYRARDLESIVVAAHKLLKASPNIQNMIREKEGAAYRDVLQCSLHIKLDLGRKQTTREVLLEATLYM